MGVPPPTTGLRIWLLGGFRAELGGQPVPAMAWRRSKAKAVVKLLALAPGHRLHREQLVDQLWPEQDPDQGAANLRKAVHYARQALAADALTADNGSLRLNGGPLWVDVDEFEARAREGDAAAAVALYGGELLPEDLFEPWTEPRREQLGLRYARLLLDRSLELAQAGHDSEAADALERLIAGDPLNEEAHVQLIRLHAVAGRTHLALQWYQQLEAQLGQELGVRPGPTARGLYENIMAGRLAPASSSFDAAGAAPAAPAGTLARPPERKLSTLVVLDGDGVDEAAVAVLLAWGATVLHEAGRPAVAVFGSPRALEDHAVRALRAALEIAAQAQPMKIAVATGDVTVAGGPAPGKDAVHGTAVETARRLAGAATPGSILVHDRTSRSTGELFDFGPVRRLRPVAGGQPVAARALLAERPVSALTESRSGLPMVGRESELAAVVSLAADVVDSSRPRLLLVQGPAGIGKSRLVQEAVGSIAGRHPATLVLQGRCRSAGRAVTFWALAEVVRQACGVALDTPIRTAQETVSRRLRDLLGPLHLASDDLDSTVFALAATAGIELPGSPLERAQPKEVAEELARAWPRFTTACAAAGPAVLVIEDLHWADDTLLEMVQRIAARSEGRLLVLCTARTELGESHPGFGSAGEHVSVVSLRPLTGTASHELLEELATRAPVPADRRTEIVSRAEGNPFFLGQLVAHVAEGGAGTLPDSVLSVLAARIDALPDIERQVIQQAAVIGRLFWAEPVSRSLDNLDVSGPLQSLERRGLILTRPTSSLGDAVELMFAHALVRDVAYGSLPPGQRSLAHERVGGWLEERAAGRRDELAELLAHHYVTAVEYADSTDSSAPHRLERLRRKAFDHLLSAGVAARRRFAVTQAVDLHEHALARAANDSERLRALEEIGDDHESAFHGHESMDAYLAALDIARARPALAPSRSRLCRKSASLMATTPGAFRVSPDPSHVQQLVDEGIEHVVDDDVERARLLIVRGAIARLWQGGEPFGTLEGPGGDPVPIEERIRSVNEALGIGTAFGQPGVVAAANDTLGVLYGVAGRYDLMLQRAREQLDLLADVPRLTQADAVRKVAVLAIEIEGRLVEGCELARKAYELSQGSNPHQMMHTTYPLLVGLYHLGRWQELLPVLDEHLDNFRQDPAVFCQFLRDGPVIGAMVQAQLGDSERVQELASMVSDPRDDPETASAWQSRLAVLCGRPEVAAEVSGRKAREHRTYGPQHALAFVEALAALEDWPTLREFMPHARAAVAGNALLAPFCNRAIALADFASGHSTVATAGLRRALDGFHALGAVVEAAHTKEQLAALVSPAEQELLLGEVAATYSSLGILPSPAAR